MIDETQAKGLGLQWQMLIGFLVGLGAGLVANAAGGGDVRWVEVVTTYITGPIGQIFLRLLFMIIIGGMGSILGCYFGAAFMWFLPILLNQLPTTLGIPLSTAAIAHLELMIVGVLIVFFLIVEPHGLARLWAVGKEKLRLWPFPH